MPAGDARDGRRGPGFWPHPATVRGRPDEHGGVGCRSFPRSALEHLHRRRTAHGELLGARHAGDRRNVRLDVLGGDAVAELLALRLADRDLAVVTRTGLDDEPGRGVLAAEVE